LCVGGSGCVGRGKKKNKKEVKNDDSRADFADGISDRSGGRFFAFAIHFVDSGAAKTW
jgi:hypothetical protein